MANETNDFSTPRVGTSSSYDFIALGSILKPLRRPATHHSSLNAIYLVAKMREGFYEASTIEFRKPFWYFWYPVYSKHFLEAPIDCYK